MNRAGARTTNFAQTSVARPRKEGFHSFCESKIEMKSQRATETRRSDSGAAVRPTRGGELGEL